MTDGEVRLQAADAKAVPGHVEWLARDGIEGVAGGFSLLVRGGEITALFPCSRLNPGADARLEDEHIEQILGLLPVGEHVRLLE